MAEYKRKVKGAKALPKKKNKAQPQQDCADILYAQIKMLKLPLPVREFRFYKHLGRNWRADLTWKTYKILVECDGGNWKNGRHVRPQGFENDCIKLNHATKIGYRVYRFTSDMIRRGEAINFIEKILGENNVTNKYKKSRHAEK